MIKNIIKFIIILNIFFFFIRNIYINNNGIIIDVDNLLNISNYEDNINFDQYSTDIKPIALYFPYYYPIDLNLNYNLAFENDSIWDSIKKRKPLYKGHHQPRIPNDNYYYLKNHDIIDKQIKLAKSHGIYGFGIYYYWFPKKKLFERPLEFIFLNKSIDFHYLIIWRNQNLEIGKEIIVQEYNEKNDEAYFEDIKKYLNDLRYIKINGKPIIGIHKPEEIKYLDKTVSIWRRKAKENGIKGIFILANYNREKFKKIDNLNFLDGVYEIPPYNLNKPDLMNNEFYYYYSGLLYSNDTLLNTSKDFKIYRGTMLEFDNYSKKHKYTYIFGEYSPEKYYMINKLIIDWTKKNHDNNNRFIFINSWNNWIEGSYLESDKKFGYASINAFSKALFNLPYSNSLYNISNLQKEAKILIQIHAFYLDLMLEVIDKVNNIPASFDLYVTTNTLDKKMRINELVKKYSKATKFEIQVVENKGRDVLPYLTQVKYIIKKYKYICHLHTKKTKFDPIMGQKWRHYLFNNLLGDRDLVSGILTDFENNMKLGIIYPETYYLEKENVIKYNKNNIKYMKYILNNIFKDKIYNIGKTIIFPSGNMFWARLSAIYQVFEQDIYNLSPKEANQYDATIMHGIERIWLFVAKLNGYYYKTILKYQ